MATLSEAHERLCRVNTEHASNFMKAARGIGASEQTALLEYLNQVAASPRDWMRQFPTTWRTRPAFRKARDSLAALLKLGDFRDDVPEGFEEMLAAAFGKASESLEDVLRERSSGPAATKAPVRQEPVQAEVRGSDDGIDAGIDDGSGSDVDEFDDGYDGEELIDDGYADEDSAGEYSADDAYVRRMRRMCKMLARTLGNAVAEDMFAAMWSGQSELESREKINGIARLLVTRAPPLLLLEAMM